MSKAYHACARAAGCSKKRAPRKPRATSTSNKKALQAANLFLESWKAARKDHDIRTAKYMKELTAKKAAAKKAAAKKAAAKPKPKPKKAAPKRKPKPKPPTKKAPLSSRAVIPFVPPPKKKKQPRLALIPYVYNTPRNSTALTPAVIKANQAAAAKAKADILASQKTYAARGMSAKDISVVERAIKEIQNATSRYVAAHKPGYDKVWYGSAQSIVQEANSAYRTGTLFLRNNPALESKVENAMKAFRLAKEEQEFGGL